VFRGSDICHRFLGERGAKPHDNHFSRAPKTARSIQIKLEFLKHVEHRGIMQIEVKLYAYLRTLDHLVVVIFYLSYAIFVDDLNQHPLEVYWQSPFEFICAHSQYFHSLLIIDVWMMVFVKN